MCGNLSMEEDVKNCDSCDKNTCMNCSSLLWCQSGSCLCKNCFKFECAFCTEKIDNSQTYLGDASYDEEYFPICTSCSTNKMWLKTTNKYS